MASFVRLDNDVISSVGPRFRERAWRLTIAVQGCVNSVLRRYLRGQVVMNGEGNLFHFELMKKITIIY